MVPCFSSLFGGVLFGSPVGVVILGGVIFDVSGGILCCTGAHIWFGVGSSILNGMLGS